MNIVILNSVAAITDLFEKKSAIYSDRYVRPYRNAIVVYYSAALDHTRHCYMNCECRVSFWTLHLCLPFMSRVGFGWALAASGYGERLRDLRKVLHQEFNADAVKRYRVIETQFCYQLLNDIFHEPDRFSYHIRR